MSQEIVLGKIIEWKEGGVIISAPIPCLDKALRREYDKVEIAFADGRRISPEQRRKIYALVNEIAEWVGEHPEQMKKQMKMEFIVNRMQSMRRRMFSLADCSMELATDFISYLIDFIVTNDIPCNHKLADMAEDIGAYVYACLMNKKCAVCGRKADLHHVDAVGMGRDRDEIAHIGMLALPLCREHHTQCHTKGKEFIDEQHLVPVKIDKYITKVYKLRGE